MPLQPIKPTCILSLGLMVFRMVANSSVGNTMEAPIPATYNPLRFTNCLRVPILFKFGIRYKKTSLEVIAPRDAN